MKMNSKFSLALIALVGVGVFALPATTALFSGQHSFYNIDATGNQIPCTKCHGDVKAELNSGLSAYTGTPGPHANFKCEYCHRAEYGMASGDDAYAYITYTNATLGDQIALVTTIQNHEIGNFPKQIVWRAGLTVDNWKGNVFANDGVTPFTNDTTYSDANGQYAGSLSTNGNGTEVYTFDFRDEKPTEINGVPKDQLATATTAFNPHAVKWSGITENLNGSGSRAVTPGTRYHAASLVSCLECHGGDQNKGAAGYQITDAMPYNHGRWVLDATDPKSTCSNCHYGNPPPDITGIKDNLMAGGFGLTDYATNSTTGNSSDTGAVEAHNDFVRAPGGVLRNGYGAANDACVACHTHVAVDINFQKKYVLNFTANAFNGGAVHNTSSPTLGNWGVGGFQAQGTVNVEEFGNQSGTSFATGNHTYNWKPGSNLYIVDANGTNMTLKVNGLTNTATDNQSALISP